MMQMSMLHQSQQYSNNTTEQKLLTPNQSYLKIYKLVKQDNQRKEDLKQSETTLTQANPKKEDREPDEATQSLQVCRFHDPHAQAKQEGKVSAISDKFYILARDDDTNAKDLQPTKEEQQFLDELAQQPCFRELQEQEKTLLWRFRYS